MDAYEGAAATTCRKKKDLLEGGAGRDRYVVDWIPNEYYFFFFCCRRNGCDFIM
jgi:hypothetical protein